MGKKRRGVEYTTLGQAIIRAFRPGLADAVGRRVHVYRNLHNGLWSVRLNGIVVGHTDHVLLQDVTFRVQPAGRAKVLREKKKNVHAYASGILVGYANHLPNLVLAEPGEVSYNPYKADTFYATLIERLCKQVVPVKTAPWVELTIRGEVKRACVLAATSVIRSSGAVQAKAVL